MSFLRNLVLLSLLVVIVALVVPASPLQAQEELKEEESSLVVAPFDRFFENWPKLKGLRVKRIVFVERTFPLDSYMLIIACQPEIAVTAQSMWDHSRAYWREGITHARYLQARRGIFDRALFFFEFEAYPSTTSLLKAGFSNVGDGKIWRYNNTSLQSCDEEGSQTITSPVFTNEASWATNLEGWQDERYSSPLSSRDINLYKSLEDLLIRNEHFDLYQILSFKIWILKVAVVVVVFFVIGVYQLRRQSQAEKEFA